MQRILHEKNRKLSQRLWVFASNLAKYYMRILEKVICWYSREYQIAGLLLPNTLCSSRGRCLTGEFHPFTSHVELWSNWMKIVSSNKRTNNASWNVRNTRANDTPRKLPRIHLTCKFINDVPTLTKQTKPPLELVDVSQQLNCVSCGGSSCRSADWQRSGSSGSRSRTADARRLWDYNDTP